MNDVGRTENGPNNGEVNVFHSELNIIPSIPVRLQDRQIYPTLLENGRKRKLVLHFDVRNTVLVADSVTSISVEQALNSYLSGVTWGREVDGKWEWHSNQPSLRPPRADTMTYYKHLEKTIVQSPADRTQLRLATGDFTQTSLGKEFLPYFEKHLQLLKWNHPYAESRDRCLTMAGKDGQPHHYILQSFYKLIYRLVETNRDFAIIIRTYGLDAKNVLGSLTYGLGGNHPGYPKCSNLPVHVIPGKVSRTNEGYICFETYNQRGEIIRKVNHERDIYRLLSNSQGVSGFKDDFPHWQENNYVHTSGKPFWIDLNDPSVHHIIFDDNFRAYEEDSIVDVRLFRENKKTAVSLSKQEAAEFEDVCLVQADLLQSTEDIDYFIRKVQICESSYSRLLKRMTVKT